ncbi:MAG: hypothetical protein HYY87_02885 [Candidatus Levybacteria bacterium]|nr:hypothetical protein [Candidatus Levybacteria bacterium]MBI3070227.1 hypothetical protein [Candidatus Levybacteria bacterium]
MVERSDLLAKIRERLGKPTPEDPEDRIRQLSDVLFPVIEEITFNPETSRILLSKFRGWLIEDGDCHTPSYLSAFYLRCVFSWVAKAARKGLEDTIPKTSIACVLDLARGAEFVIDGLFAAHESPPYASPRRPGHVVSKLLEEDPSGAKVIDWCIEALKRDEGGSLETPFGEPIQVSDPLKPYENRAMAIAGAELFKKLYLRLYPTAEQICSDVKTSET